MGGLGRGAAGKYVPRTGTGGYPTYLYGTYSSGEPRRYILSVQTDSSFKLTLGLVDVC